MAFVEKGADCVSRKVRQLIILKRLFLLCLLLTGLYVLWGNAFPISFILNLRLKKVLIFLLVSICSSYATIAFQAIVGNHFLSPGIMGIESYYRFLATLIIFLGAGSLTDLHPAVEFLFVILIMIASYIALSKVSWENISFDLHTVLMVGLVLGILFNSMATFFQVLMDPNEYDQLQTRLFPTFQNVSNPVLLTAACIAIPNLVSLWKKKKILEVLALGMEEAVSLGIDTNQEINRFFLQIVVLSAVPAVLVGPMTFLGFTTANLTYLLFSTYRMEILLTGASILGFLLLLSGQFIVEQVFQMQTNVSIIVEWAGGLLFFVLLWKERKET